MRKNCLNNYNNNNNNNFTNNISHSKSNYINPNTQKSNNNIFQSQQSLNINNSNNSIAFNSPLSSTINYNNISQRQLDISSRNNKPSKDFSKTLLNRTNDTPTNNRDSKAVKIKNITKKPIYNSYSQNMNRNNKSTNINNNNLRNRGNNFNMQNNNSQNIANKKPLMQSYMNKNMNNNSKINASNKINRNKVEDSDESSDYGNADDDDFESILRESINIRETQNMMNVNNNSTNAINNKNNPFSKNKNSISQPIKNTTINKENMINKNIKENLNNKIHNINNDINNNINNINKDINNNINNNLNIMNNKIQDTNNSLNNLNTMGKIQDKIEEEKNNIVNNLENINSFSGLDDINNKANEFVNKNLEKKDIFNDEVENKVYNTMNNYFDKIGLESNKNEPKIVNNMIGMNNIDLMNKNEGLSNDNIINDNFGKIKDNINVEQNYIKLNDYFSGDDNPDNKDNFLNENINFNNIYNMNNMNNIVSEENNIINNPLSNLNVENNFFDNKINNNDDDINHNINENINNNNDQYNDINTYNINDNLNKDKKNEELISSGNMISSKINLENPETKNQFINHNISIDSSLKQIQFLERLKSISNTRYSYFIKKYQKDNYFMEKEQFDNNFVNEKNLQVQSPLTLIFHYIFNPDTPIPESGKSFFETIFTKRGDQNYVMSYNKNELIEIPKFFDNFSYVNKLFNTFDIENLNNFLEEINNWKETFSFEQHFVYPLYMFKRAKSITMKDIATVYFISPYDLIIDYHSYGSELPLSDTFVCISQYRFHCDIDFDIKKGKFIFKTRGQIYNTLRFIKDTLLKKTIRNESNNTNKEELQVNTWSPLKNVIESEDKKNQKIVEQVYEQYLLNNINKYSKEVPKDYDIFYGDDVDNWNSFSDSDDKEKKKNVKNEDNFFDEFKIDIEDRNFMLLKYVGIFIIFLLVCKIFWAFGSGNVSFGTLFNSIIVILLGYALIKFR